MDWLSLVEPLVGSKYFQDLTLVMLIIAVLRTHIKKVEISVEGIRTELQSLKSVFRDQNKRIANIEGTQEAMKYEVHEMKLDLKQLKRE
jgi:predicted  nucleic acid-binding Zn-ribbon protein